MKEYLVHIRNHISGWVMGTYHQVAEDAESAADQVCAALGMLRPEFNDAIRVITQELGPAAKEVVTEEKQAAEQEVKSEPVPETPAAVVSEAEQVAASILASLPPDVLAALKNIR